MLLFSEISILLLVCKIYESVTIFQFLPFCGALIFLRVFRIQYVPEATMHSASAEKLYSYFQGMFLPSTFAYLVYRILTCPITRIILFFLLSDNDRMRELGQLVVYDILRCNHDRNPAGFWKNQGNPGNTKLCEYETIYLITCFLYI